MKRTLVLSFALVVAGAELAHAQIIQPMRRTGPLAWVSLGAGWMQTNPICDPVSKSCWNFGGAPQWRASLEYPLDMGVSAGVVGTTARVPLYWAGNGIAPNQCAGCDADANVTQVLGNLHIGGGAGFHQVIDVVAGATLFSNFRTTDGAKLGPGKTVTDMTFGLGYGVGYGLSSRTSLAITQEWGLIVHKRQPGNPSNTAQQQTTRLAFRVGLGDR